MLQSTLQLLKFACVSISQPRSPGPLGGESRRTLPWIYYHTAHGLYGSGPLAPSNGTQKSVIFAYVLCMCSVFVHRYTKYERLSL